MSVNDGSGESSTKRCTACLIHVIEKSLFHVCASGFCFTKTKKINWNLNDCHIAKQLSCVVIWHSVQCNIISQFVYVQMHVQMSDTCINISIGLYASCCLPGWVTSHIILNHGLSLKFTFLCSQDMKHYESQKHD